MNNYSAELHDFERQLSSASTPEAAYTALCELTQKTVGAKLFTVMTVDMTAGLAQRVFTNDPESYPASGTKPIERNSWFEVVHDQHECFVANTIEQIAEVFSDHTLIASLGCESVVNLPIILNGTLAATVNILDERNYYTEERLGLVKQLLILPSLAALCVAKIQACPVIAPLPPV